jgi:adenine-specific DNA methylase
MKELNEFIDEQYQTEEEEGFKVDTPSKADWALGKIRDAKEQQDRNILLANEKKEQIIAWLNEANDKLQNTVDHFQSHLAVYAQLKREEDPKYKSEKLPSGRIRFKKQQPAYKYDEEKTLQWLKENGYTDLINVKEAPKKTDIKKRFLPHNGKLVDAELGMEVEGVEIVEQPDKFEVEV